MFDKSLVFFCINCMHEGSLWMGIRSNDVPVERRGRGCESEGKGVPFQSSVVGFKGELNQPQWCFLRIRIVRFNVLI